MIDKELIHKYNLIKTPEELLNFMSNNINYGYLGKNDKIYYFGDVDFLFQIISEKFSLFANECYCVCLNFFLKLR
jgi:hypothetical protein